MDEETYEAVFSLLTYLIVPLVCLAAGLYMWKRRETRKREGELEQRLKQYLHGMES